LRAAPPMPILVRSMTPAVPIAPEAHANRVGPPILAYEATRGDGRVMLVEAFGEPDGHVTVDAEIWPVRAEKRSEPLLASYRFGSVAAATKFVDEAMIALEYLGCTVAKSSHNGRD
jgi:hypothetical protein